MSRLTEKEHGEYEVYCSHNDSIDCIDCNVCKWKEAMVEKLAHYEDLEVQGRLIELPCKPDEWVWEAHEKYPTRQTMYCSNAHIVESMESGYCIGYTKAEAETKLKELKEGAE